MNLLDWINLCLTVGIPVVLGVAGVVIGALALPEHLNRHRGWIILVSCVIAITAGGLGYYQSRLLVNERNLAERKQTDAESKQQQAETSLEQAEAINKRALDNITEALGHLPLTPATKTLVVNLAREPHQNPTLAPSGPLPVPLSAQALTLAKDVRSAYSNAITRYDQQIKGEREVVYNTNLAAGMPDSQARQLAFNSSTGSGAGAENQGRLLMAADAISKFGPSITALLQKAGESVDSGSRLKVQMSCLVSVPQMADCADSLDRFALAFKK